MKHHECPTCGQHYCCPRSSTKCGSPLVYDCFACYVRRYCQELEAASDEVVRRFSLPDDGTGFCDICFAD